MANFDGVPGCNSTERADSRRSTLIRAVGHCYGQPARIARKEPRKTGSHGRQAATEGRKPEGRKPEGRKPEGRKPEEGQPRNTQNTRKSGIKEDKQPRKGRGESMERGGVSRSCGGRGLGEDGKGRRVGVEKQKNPR